MFPKLPSLFAAVLILSGCSPIIKNPIELAPFTYAPAYEGRKLALDWSVQTRQPESEKTSTLMLPAAGAGYVTMGGYEVPNAQLLTEEEQRDIAAQLKSLVTLPSREDLCKAELSFEELDYEFHQHQYWATVSLTVSRDGEELFKDRHKIWSAEHMSFLQRMNAFPQTGKRALAQQLMDALVASVSEVSNSKLSACAL